MPHSSRTPDRKAGRRSAAPLAGVSRELAAIGRRFYARGWALGTSGNFSAVVSRRPLRLAVTASGVHKGRLSPSDILHCDDRGLVVGRARGRPSAETLLHVALAKRGAGAVLHTHSVWAVALAEVHAGRDGFAIEGFEMLKGLDGITSHEHREWIPLIDNDQDIARLAMCAADALDRHPAAHAFVLRRHGLYTWGATLAEAERHVEILEYLFETIGRAAALAQAAAAPERRL
jgi:methylthioribulose-1-phosphate dehydratase